MKLRLALVVLCCVISVVTGLVLSRTGATPQSSSKRARPLIGLSLDTLKEERWQRDRDNFVKKAAELGADVKVQSANGDDVRQIADVQSLITAGVDVIVIAPHNGDAMAKAVNLAHDAGIPVLAYDRIIRNSDLDLYMTFDNLRVGELQAQFLVDALAKSGSQKKRIIRLYGAKTDNNAVIFKAGQDKVLKPLIDSGAIEVVHEDWVDDWKPENAKKVTNAGINKAGHNFDAILASNDGTAGGAIQALIEEGLAGKVLVTGQDADLAALQRIVAGTQSMTIYKPLKGLANRAAEYAVRLAKGRPIIATGSYDNGQIQVPTVLLDVILVTKDNLRETVIKDGFHTEEEVFANASATK
jgi:D-xylose transport system substrate-binding protein